MGKKAKDGSSIIFVCQIVFIILKATSLINCSWWLVFLPLWITLGFGLFILVFAIISLLIIYLIALNKGNKYVHDDKDEH